MMDLPLFFICHKPVIPAGARNLLARESVVRVSASYKGNGRLPTRDMFPTSTFNNWGNSSRLVFLRNFPTRVMRGSFSILKNRASSESLYWLRCAKLFLYLSAPVTMVLNL